MNQRKQVTLIGEIWPTAMRPATTLPPHIRVARPMRKYGRLLRRDITPARAVAISKPPSRRAVRQVTLNVNGQRELAGECGYPGFEDSLTA